MIKGKTTGERHPNALLATIKKADGWKFNQEKKISMT